MKQQNDKKYPVLRGRVVGNQIYVHCPWCDREHVHGWNPTEVRPSFRAPHCFNGCETDYLIAPFRKKDVCHHQSTSREVRLACSQSNRLPDHVRGTVHMISS